MRTVLITNLDRAWRNTELRCGMLCGSALLVLAMSAPAAAQRSMSDRDLLNRQHSSGLSTEDRKRFDELKEGEARHQANKEARRSKLLRLPPLPDERNVLLGSWRLEDAGQGGGDTGFGQRKGTGGTDAMFRELWATLESNPDKLLCNPVMFGHGITFASSTYSIQALDGSVSRSSIDYRSTERQVIVAIPGNMEMDLLFQIAGPNHGLPPAAKIVPVAGSATTCWIGQVSQNGPLSAQVRRAASLSKKKAPFLVPTRMRTLVMRILPLFTRPRPPTAYRCARPVP